MKRRTFLLTLTLFLLSMNAGILLFSIYSYKSIIGQASEKGLSEHYILVSSLAKDMYSLDSRGIKVDASLDILFQPYQYLTSSGGIILTKDDTVIYTSGVKAGSLDVSSQSDNDHRVAKISRNGEEKYLVVKGSLPEPFSQYGIQYFANVTKAYKAWQAMSNTFFIAGFLISCLLALILLLLLNRVFRPLYQISSISSEIADGDYHTRLPDNGKDELAEMSRNFNRMASQVEQQIAELRETSEKKQLLIDSLAHELRTPLTAIYGYAEYLQKTNPSEEDRLSALEYILSESHRLQHMANQLLELANLRHDEIQMKQVDIRQLIHKVLQTLDLELANTQIQLDCQLDAAQVWGDEVLLESLFLNLLHNAVKACGVCGHIKIKSIQTDDGAVVVSVQDTGKGIPEDALSSITDPFFRVDRARSRRDGGAGLGLAICQQIAQRHGASLSFTSVPGTGTTAAITFTT